MTPIGDRFAKSTETFILGMANFMPHPFPPVRAPKTKHKKRKKRKCAT